MMVDSEGSYYTCMTGANSKDLQLWFTIVTWLLYFKMFFEINNCPDLVLKSLMIEIQKDEKAISDHVMNFNISMKTELGLV